MADKIHKLSDIATRTEDVTFNDGAFKLDGKSLWINSGKVWCPYGIRDNCLTITLGVKQLKTMKELAAMAGLDVDESLRIYTNRHTFIYDADGKLSDISLLANPCYISLLLNAGSASPTRWNLWPRQIRVWQRVIMPEGCKIYNSLEELETAVLKK